MDDIIKDFGFTTGSPKIIKVIGVGGGGCNAVSHMYRQGIDGVTFLVCNTDMKSVADSPVPDKLLLGEGLGAGNDPEEGRRKAEECVDRIRECFDDDTRMVFITAGMGGGTGTGAAPVVAKVARQLGILSVGIVTIPYRWEGNRKIDKALDGVEEISKYVDALIVVKNDNLRDVYGDLKFEAGYDRADDIALVAAKSISDIITMHGKINLDFNDIRMVLQDGGVAIIGTGYGEGEGRLTKAFRDAQTSPLLNDNDVFNARKVVICISYSSQSELIMSELDEVNEFMSAFSPDIQTKHGVEKDESLGPRVKVTLLATGFGMADIHMQEMDRRLAARTDEELEQQAEDEERRRLRRERYYGPDADGRRRPFRRRHIYLFSTSDLDNASLLALVEDTPTARRDRATLQAIRAKSKEADLPQALHNDQEGVISFE